MTGTELLDLSKSLDLSLDSEGFIKKLDELDPLKEVRNQFIIPKKKYISERLIESLDVESESIYLCSNSLGLQPKRLSTLINQELEVWANRGVLGHSIHDYSRPWITVDDNVTPLLAPLVGAKESEVTIMSTLTSNLHLLLTNFYKPTVQRNKILIENKAFPSDHYAVISQLQLHNQNVDEALVLLKENPETLLLDEQYILDTIKELKDSLAIVLLPGIQYFTGQSFDFKKITELAHQYGILVGFDLAHAVGNIKLNLHEWNVDFACWCTYKYLSSGPGNIGGLFIHEKFSSDPNFTRLTGWWSHKLETRFDMSNELVLEQGVKGFRMSNPSVLSVTSLLASLQIYKENNFLEEFTKKSKLMTQYLIHKITTDSTLKANIKILTPLSQESRGCQLSLKLHDKDFDKVFNGLLNRGIVVDERKPNVIRVGPYPFINSFSELNMLINALIDILQK